MNIYFIVIAFVWFVHMNAYFGWNRTPQSLAELAADALFLVLLAIGLGWKIS